MATKVIAWPIGSGNITLSYNGQGDGAITVQSDENDLDVSRSQSITVETTKGGTVSKSLTITQAAGPNFRLYGGDILRLADGNYLSVSIPNS
jgi:uncharacterized protein (DUF2345 family)